jgi:superfamily II DNA or RNA helicase
LRPGGGSLMQNSSSSPRVGDSVRVRGQRWRVNDIRDYGSCRLFSLVGTASENRETEQRFLTPFDNVVRIERRERSRRVSQHAWIRLLRGYLAEHVPAGGLRTALRAAIDLLPYQLEPALALLEGMGTRVLLADEVGLGKTVQAALAVAELRSRGLADRVLVLTPPGLRDQWRDELSARFSIDAEVIDARELRRHASAAPLGTNPWTRVPVAVASTDFIKRPEVLPLLLEVPWDIVVVDEAHGAASRSDRHHATSALCRQTPYVLLITATPHNGDTKAFESLRNLGALGSSPLLLFRRTRDEVALHVHRRAHLLRVTLSNAERSMYARLAEFAHAVGTEHRDEGGHLRLALSVLYKRAFSSAASLSESVRRRLTALDFSRPPETQMDLPFRMDAGEQDWDDEVPAWTVPGLADPERERRLLEAVDTAACQAASREAKLGALHRLLRRLLGRGERVLVFTEYRDTLARVRQSLMWPAVVIHGGLNRQERLSALGEFSNGAARVLLATDAAGEGLNLQAACRSVINLELPWNPNRLEQRAGRVDRIGQSRTVHLFYLMAGGTGEEDILARMRERIVRGRRDIGMADPFGDSPLPPASGPPHTRIDPSVECDRLASVRAISSRPGASGAPEYEGPLIARSRHLLRQRLNGRVLVVLCSSLENEYGQRLACRVWGAMIDGRLTYARTLDGYELHTLTRALGRAVMTADSPRVNAWFTAERSAHRRLIAELLARRSEIQAVWASAPSSAQLGLFDRRAHRAIVAAADRQLARRRDAEEQRARLERAAIDATLTSRIALVLLP